MSGRLIQFTVPASSARYLQMYLDGVDRLLALYDIQYGASASGCTVASASGYGPLDAAIPVPYVGMIPHIVDADRATMTVVHWAAETAHTVSAVDGAFRQEAEVWYDRKKVGDYLAVKFDNTDGSEDAVVTVWVTVT